jgi:hypothetical protein
MKKIIERINRVSVCEIESATGDKLILKSTPRKIANPLFIVGIIGFVSSSLLRGFLNWHIGDIFLALFTMILVSGVWHLSAAGKFIINKNENKIFRVYRHLGYLQKVYSYPIATIDTVLLEKMQGENFIFLLKDDRKKVWVAQEKKALNELQEVILKFLSGR